MASSTIKNRISDFIGSGFDIEIEGELELVCSAFNEVLDLCPLDLLFKYVDTYHNLYSGGTSFATEGKKVIKVLRRDVNSIGRVARKVPFSEGLAATDTNSIYYVDADQDKSPTFYITASSGNLIVLPTVTGTAAGNANTAFVYYTKYFTPNDTVSILDKVWESTTDSTLSIIQQGYPREATHAAILKSAINILNAKVSQATQDEEDAELLGLLQGQSQSLIASYNSELKRMQEVME